MPSHYYEDTVTVATREYVIPMADFRTAFGIPADYEVEDNFTTYGDEVTFSATKTTEKMGYDQHPLFELGHTVTNYWTGKRNDLPDITNGWPNGEVGTYGLNGAMEGWWRPAKMTVTDVS